MNVSTKVRIAALSAAVILAAQATLHAVVLESWEFSTLATGAAGTTPVGSLAPVTVGSDVNPGNLLLGTGTGGPVASTTGSTFGASNFALTTDLNTAIAAHDFVSFTLSAAANSSLSLDSISAYNVRRSGTGPTLGQWQYSLDGTNFVNIGSTITWGSVTSATGNPQSAITLNSIAALQGVNAGTNITLRVVAYAPSSSGNWYLNNISAGNDLILNGTVGAINTTPTLNYLDTNGTTPGIGIADGTTTVWDNDTLNFSTLVDGTGSPFAFNPSLPVIFGGTPGTVTVSNVAPSAGIQFTNSGTLTGYTLNAGDITLVTSPSITVSDPNQTATINSQISGAVGLTKGGNGTLVLGSTASDFTGPVTISLGVLSISDDRNLGDSANSVSLGGGSLQTTASITTARAFTGGGVIDIAGGTTLATSGSFVVSTLTLSDAGTLDLQAASSNVGNLIFTGAGTLTSSTAQSIAVTTIVATNLTGTATISGSGGINLGGGAKTLDVGAGGTLIIQAPITLTGTGNNSLKKTGAGTLVLNGVNSSLYRVQIGTSSSSGSTSGGTIQINNNAALGIQQFFLNDGTLNVTSDLTGANALTIGASIAALDNGPAVITGSPIEFTGGTGIFAIASNSNHLTVNNTTIISGNFSSNATPAGSALNLDGAGKLIVNGSAAGMLIPTNLAGNLTLAVNNQWADPITLNGGTLGGSGVIAGIVTAGTGTGAHTIAPSAGLAATSATNLSLADLATNSNTTFVFNVASTTSGDLINVTSSSADFTIGTGTALDVAFSAVPTSVGNYHLFNFTGLGAAPAVPANLAAGLLVTGGGAFSYTLADDGAYIDLVGSIMAGVPAGSGTWHNGSGDNKWTTNTAAGSNWNTGIPNGADQSALFDDSAVGGAGTVTLNGDKTVGELDLHTGSAGYTIGADSTYTLNFQASGHAVISVTGTGSHTINANSNLVSTTDVSVATGGSLNMVGAVSGGALTLAGGGTLSLSSPTGNTYGGPTTVSGGTLIVSNATGSATGSGDVTLNGGTLGGAGKISGNVLASSNDHTIYPSAGLVSPTSATNLTLGSLTTSSHTTLEFNLDGGITNHGVGVGLDLGTSDTITTGTLTLNGGTIAIANTQTGMNSLGYYKLIAYSSIAGAGLSSLTLPTAPAGTAVVYTLDTSHDTGFIDLHRGFTGDANDDGVVNFTDFISLASDFGQPGDWAQGDFNGDGIVNFTDFIALAANFGQTIGGASETVSASEVAEFNAAASSFFGSPSSVPEPTSLALMGLGAAALLKRRRKI